MIKNIALLFKVCVLSVWLFACTNVPIQTPLSPTENSTPLLEVTPTLIPMYRNNIEMQIVATPQMHQGRAAYTATRLSNGFVLLVGGFTTEEQALADSELFDPETNTFLPTGTMSVARQSHTATLLPNGKVLISGGFNGDYLKSAELYDPKTGLFTPTNEMTVARSGHIAVMLDTGKVLIAGGTGEGWTFLETAEIYDPETSTFTLTGNMTVPRESHTGNLLLNGKVLITGGHQGKRGDIVIYASAELYDPITGTFSETDHMTVKRHKHDATLLPDGCVFVSGGSDERDSDGAYRSTEIYDPALGIFISTGEMISRRYKHNGTSLLLNNGLVLLIGGANTAESFDPQSRKFSKFSETLGTTRLFATSTLLLDGRVLFAGGYGVDIASSKTAWILQFTP